MMTNDTDPGKCILGMVLMVLVWLLFACFLGGAEHVLKTLCNLLGL